MPARRIGPKTRSQSGLFWSRKNGGILLPYESLLEHDYCVNLEFDNSVLAFETQPVKIHFYRGNRKCPGYPDVLVSYRDEHVPKQALIDVKSAKELSTNWAHLRPRFRGACQYARSNGMSYHIRSEHHIYTPSFYNARRLLRYLRNDPDPNYAVELLNVLGTMCRTTITTLLDACFDDQTQRAQALTALWTLIAHHKVGVDFTRPIDSVTCEVWSITGEQDAKIA